MRSDVSRRMRHRWVSCTAGREQIVGGVLGVRVVGGIHHLSDLLLLLLVHVVRQLRLLVPGGGHPLVHVSAGHGRRVWRVQTRLKLKK